MVRVVGLDVGERRIGIAVSDVSRTLARPLRTIVPGESLAERVTAVAGEIAQLAGESDGLAAVVVGLPCSLDGQPHAQTERVLAFVEALRGTTDVPVALQDERLTSVEAEARLAVRESDWRRRKARLDAASAAVILQDYLDQRLEAGGSGPEARG